MSGLIGYIIGVSMGEETENVWEDAELALMAGLSETVLAPLFAMLFWLIGKLPASISMPEALSVSIQFSFLGIVGALIGLFAAGTIFGLLGIWTRKFFHWIMEL